MKKSLSIILSFMFVILCMAGCTTKSELHADEPVTLTMWHVYGEQADSPMNRLIDEFNKTIGKEKGIVILLTASPETIESRLKNDKSRPLIGENMDLGYIRELMSQREETYRSVADMIISTDDKTIDDICKEIVESLGFTL